MLNLALALLLLQADGPSPLAEAVNSAFERVGRAAPLPDATLQTAAEVLARKALASGSAAAATSQSVATAVLEAGGTAPAPRALIVRGQKKKVFQALRESSLTNAPADIYGAALVENGPTSALAIVVAVQRGTIYPQPSKMERPGSAEYCWDLPDDLTFTGVYVTYPDGRVATAKHVENCAMIPFPLGRTTVEILAKNERGPQVVSLFQVLVGSPTAAAISLPPASGTIPERINAERQRQGAAPLESDPRLDAIATKYALRLAQENYFAHVDPRGGELTQRLRESGYTFVSAAENLGLAKTLEEAHASILLSPGHRRTLLSKAYTHLGIGSAQRSDGFLVLVELVARPLLTVEQLRTLALDIVNALRVQHALPKLQPVDALDNLALARALRARRGETQLEQSPLQEVFTALPSAQAAAGEIYRTTDLQALRSSKNASQVDFDSVGIGITPTDDGRSYWVALYYAAIPTRR